MGRRGNRAGKSGGGSFAPPHRGGLSGGVEEGGNLRAQDLGGRLSSDVARVMANPTLMRLGLYATHVFPFKEATNVSE
jgi:hypothetical protein